MLINVYGSSAKYSTLYYKAWFKVITVYAVHPSEQGLRLKRNELAFIFLL